MSQEYPNYQPSGRPTGDSGPAWQEKIGEIAREVESRGRELINEGNSRRLVVEQNGRDIVNMPVTVAAVIGGVAVIAAPALAVLGFVAALMARVRARIEK